MEPPVADLPARSLPKPNLLTLGRAAAAGAAAGMALFSVGSAVVVCGLLAVAAWDAAVTVVAVCAVVVELARFGTGSMTAIGGAQAVLGAGWLMGPLLAAVSSLCLLLSMGAVAPSRRLAVPLAVTAVALTSAPGLTGPLAVVERVGMAAAVAALVWWVADVLHTDARPAVALGVVAAGLALASRPSGALQVAGLFALGSRAAAVLAAIAGAAVAVALSRR